MGIMKKDIEPMDRNYHWHGYQEWYLVNKIWLRGYYKHGQAVGYLETFGDYDYNTDKSGFDDLNDYDLKKTQFFIR